MLRFADEAALARLLIGAAAIAPAKCRQWVKRIASQLDPAVVHLAPALPGRHGRCLGTRGRVQGGDAPNSFSTAAIIGCLRPALRS